MCAIVDKNVFHELWEQGGTPAGQGFRRVIESGRIPLAFGGTMLRHEVATPGKSSRMKAWIQQLQSAGRLVRVADDEVDQRTQDLSSGDTATSSFVRSDDPHIIALADISHARLLYTNDKDLTDDFRDPRIIKSPRGHVYSTNETSEFNKRRRDLLARTDLCARRVKGVS